MRIIVFCLLSFVCLICKADTLEPFCVTHTACCESSCNVPSKYLVDKEEVRWLKKDLRELDKKIRILENLETATPMTLKMVGKQNADDGNDEWNIYMASWTLLGLITAVSAIGLVFIVKENGASKKAIELAEQEVELAKRKLRINVDRAVDSFSRKAENELVVFRARMELLEISRSQGELNNDDVYSAMTVLKANPRTSFLSIYNRLKDLNLEDDVKDYIQEAINELSSN
jgi:hypothetical protein